MNKKDVCRIVSFAMAMTLFLAACGNQKTTGKKKGSGSDPDGDSSIPVISIPINHFVDVFADETQTGGNASDTSDAERPPVRMSRNDSAAAKKGGDYTGVRDEAKALYLSKQVLQRSILNKGNTARVARALKKAANKEKIVIATVGGSITQGTAASSPFNSYAGKFRDWWSTEYPDTPIEFYNIGKGATTSMMGAHRVGRELLDKNPDLVVVDFSVNDSDDPMYKESYESLIRQLLQNQNSPAVICLFMMDQSGWNTENLHLPIARHYDLPAISYREALWPTNGEKLYTWAELSPDNIHPNDTGHAIINELLVYYLDTVRSKLSSAPTKIPAVPKALTKNSYANARLINSLDVKPKKIENFFSTVLSYQFPNGWMTVNGGILTVDLTDAKNIYLLYESVASGSGGIAEVSVDGGKPIRVSSDRVVEWGDCAQIVELMKGDKVGNHTVTVKVVSKAPKDKFTVLGFLVS